MNSSRRSNSPAQAGANGILADVTNTSATSEVVDVAGGVPTVTAENVAQVTQTQAVLAAT
jgi:hypothetical protein